MLQLLGYCFLLLISLEIIKQACLRTIFHVSHTIVGGPHLGIWFFSIFFFPGTVIHELAHYFMAKLLFVRTGGMTVWPKTQGSSLTLGSVAIIKPDPFRSLLVGIAPFLFGLCATTVLSFYAAEHILHLSALGSVTFDQGVTILRSPLTCVILYALIAVSQSMFPSKADRGELFLIPLAAIALGSLIWYAHSAVVVPQAVVDFVTYGLVQLNRSLTIIVVLNATFLLGLVFVRKVFDTIL